jgi:hypothetical protein
MAMGSVFWEKDAYSSVERLFRQSAEFCSEHDTWKLNVAHTFFMQVWGGAGSMCGRQSASYTQAMLTSAYA